MAVLDGQQRLRSLQLFVKDLLRVGVFDPPDDAVSAYRGRRFSQLPTDVRRRIFNYKIPCYRLYDYAPEEPYELFFRLNLPTGLTQAEKRNALFGPSRAQVKDLVRRRRRSDGVPVSWASRMRVLLTTISLPEPAFASNVGLCVFL